MGAHDGIFRMPISVALDSRFPVLTLGKIELSCSLKKHGDGRSQFCSVVRGLALELKGPGFRSAQGLTPWPWTGACRRQPIDGVSFSSMFLSLSLTSLPSTFSKKINEKSILG